MKKQLLCITLFSLMLQSCNFFASGSYPFAEYYSLNISKETLVSRINEFKEKYPDYKLCRTSPEGIVTEIPDEQEETYYNLYFYLKDIDLTLHCIIKGENYIPIKIGLDAISEGTNFAGWKDLNTKDLTDEQNAAIKKRFETEILNKLGSWERVRTRF